MFNHTVTIVRGVKDPLSYIQSICPYHTNYALGSLNHETLQGFQTAVFVTSMI